MARIAESRRPDAGAGPPALVHRSATFPSIPKSTHRERIAENSRVFDFALSDVDLEQLDRLDRTGGTDCALERKWW